MCTTILVSLEVAEFVKMLLFPKTSEGLQISFCFQFQALPLCSLSEDEVGVASLFQVFQAPRLSTMPSVRGSRQESESLQGVHAK